MVTMRSVLGMKLDKTFSVVVFPEPVPPDTTMLKRASTAACMNCAASRVSVPKLIRSVMVNGSRANLRIVIVGPVKDNGGMIALKREPSRSLPSTIGDFSSMRRPSGATMRSTTCITCSLSRKRLSESSSLPRRST